MLETYDFRQWAQQQRLLNAGSASSQYETQINDSKEAQPDGRRFELLAQDRNIFVENDLHLELCSNLYSLMIGVVCIIGLPILAGYFFYNYQKKDYILWAVVFTTIWLMMICCVCWCGGCCQDKNKEKWLKYILIINTNNNKLYIINESNLKRWKLINRMGLTQIISISTKWDTRTKGFASSENGYIILKLRGNRTFTVNEKSATIEAVRSVASQIEKYMQQQQSLKLSVQDINIKEFKEGIDIVQVVKDRVLNIEEFKEALKCPECEDSYPKDRKFCSRCGCGLIPKMINKNNDLEGDDKHIEQNKSFIKCQSCGKKNLNSFNSSKKCWKCGGQLT